jgi:ADP-heptose:LPS heptosyltransferase
VQLPANRKLDKYLGYCLIALLLPVTRLLGIVLRNKYRQHPPPKHLLFIKLLGLGSLVVASEAITTLRKQLPGTKFILLTDANIAQGIEPFALFDDIWVVDTSNLSATISTSCSFIAKSWTLKNLWVADLEVYSKLTTVYALCTLAVKRFGFYLRPVFFRKYLNTHNIFFDQHAFLEDNYFQMAQAISGNKEPLPRAYPWPVRQQEYQKPYIIVNNTCSLLAPARKLPDATVAAICIWIIDKTPFRVAFTGTAGDRPVIDQFINEHIASYKQQGKLINLAGTLDFEAYYRFIADKGVCMVTIDSGPLHIARKLGMPTVSIWGPTNPANYLKLHDGDEKRHLFHYDKVACSPCVHHHEQLPCGGNNVCMKNTTAQQIIDKIQQLLNHLKKENISEGVSEITRSV